MLKDRLIYVEGWPGAMGHAVCQPSGPFIAMPILDPRPYAWEGNRAAVQSKALAAVQYAQICGLAPEQLALRIDAGMTFAMVGCRQGDRDGGMTLVGPDAPAAVAGYSTGCLDYRRRVNLPKVGTAPGWSGSEFENLCAIADVLIAKGFAAASIYHNALGEAALSSWMQGSNPETTAALAGLSARNSMRLRARGFPATVDPVNDWGQWWIAARRVIDTTAVRMSRDAGLMGSIVVAQSSSVALPARDCDGRFQPACDPIDGRVSHANWTLTGHASTAACVECLHAHRAEKDEYWAHFSLNECTIEEVAARIRFGGPMAGEGASVVFVGGDAGGEHDRKAAARLSGLADIVRSW